jgi:hypothetical protein
VAQSEGVADLVGEGFDLLLSGLGEHPRIDRQLVPAGVREERAGQDTSLRAAVVDGAHHDLEVPGILALAEPDRHDVLTPRQKGLTEEFLDSDPSGFRISETLSERCWNRHRSVTSLAQSGMNPSVASTTRSSGSRS